MPTEPLSIALEAVAAAASFCTRVRAELLHGDAITKEDRSPVTIADFGSQALICARLRAHFPTVPIVAEEDAAELRGEGSSSTRARILAFLGDAWPGVTEDGMLDAIDEGNDRGGGDDFWTIDPIDGTKGYLRGDQYAIALARIQQGRVTLGVLACPAYGALDFGKEYPDGVIFFGARGGGAYVQSLTGGDPAPIHVSASQRSEDLAFCEPFESAHASHGASARIAEILGTGRPPVRIDSQGKYAVVAAGEADLYLRTPSTRGYQQKIWDHAAGVLLVEEAGGRVTDVHGKPLDFSTGTTLARNEGVIASNGPLHDRIVAAAQSALECGG